MEIQQDFKELLELLNAHEVDYMVVGAHALAHYGAPRFTGDIDIFVAAEPGNARRILDALDAFGFGSLGLAVEDFALPDKMVQLGVAPVRIDILSDITGVSWQEAVGGQVAGFYGDVPVHYIGKEQFVANKRAIGRAKDLADLEAIGEK